MIRDYRAVRVMADTVAAAAEQAMEAYRNSRVVDEPHITDRFLGAVEARLSARLTATASSIPGGGFWPGVRWEAMTLRAGSRSAAHEKKYGADFLGVFEANLPHYKIKKGFLAQAKRAEPGMEFSRSEWERLQEQCEKMLKQTPDAFVLIYSKRKGMRYFSAQAVKATNQRNIFHLYDMPTRSFFERHFQSFIGDPKLDDPSIETLKRLNADVPEDERPSAHVLSIRVTPGE